ncbi:hypothetical protein DL764_010256 [Monosporascus ibericus]|uniref:DUF676 domain-containing protein n=1 Tax=Monosporascus ibericus TaxID=155417 RepID=A0A4Q4SVT3_9PEZI|nr:hypothetical protein DL764_010256 [Monosporascus ibericus]
MASHPSSREIKATQIGLKVWFLPKEADDVELDVVAVHGIAEDPDETWVHETTKTNWLRDELMLPGALKKARIMRFGYNSVWFGKKAVKQSLGTVAGGLLSALKMKRKECQQRPIIFIGHCLGGLVIEQSYITAKLEPDLYPGIYESITGIVFLGTPHRGNFESQKTQKTQAAVFAAITQAKMQVQENILSTLAQDNDTLLNTVTQFSRDIRNQTSPPMLHCFFEQVGCNTGKMAGVETDPEEEEFVVNESSGTFDHHPKGGLALDHFQINKFENEEDGNYEFVRETIIEMMERTKGILNGRETSKALPTSQRHGIHA